MKVISAFVEIRHKAKSITSGFGLRGRATEGDLTMNFKSLLLAAAVACGAPAIASAEEASTSVNFGIASDYIFRGVNQNIDGGPQVFAGIDVSSGIVYLGAWASNVNFGTDATAEVDFYAGVKPVVGPVTFDFGVLAYLYPQETDLRIFEAKAAATIATEAGPSFTGSLFYSPEYGKDGPAYLYGELAAAAPIPGAKLGPFALSVAASVGYNDSEDDGGDYTNWKLGVTAATEAGWAVDVFYTDTDVDGNDLYEGKGVVQLKKTF
jgi:uncharacterized protein (TIGR02001 family)